MNKWATPIKMLDSGSLYGVNTFDGHFSPNSERKGGFQHLVQNMQSNLQ